MPVGYVALLDVLGFSSLVSSDGDGRRLESYLECLQNALRIDASRPQVDFVVFSDSIVLTTSEDSEGSLPALLLGSSRVLGLMLAAGIPVRGAIAYGSYSRRAVSSSVFVAGKAIIDAYRFEMAQDWVGIMLAPSAVERVPRLAELCSIGVGFPSVEELVALGGRVQWAAFVQPCHRIPFHSIRPAEEYEFDGYAIVPSNGDTAARALRDSLTQSLKSLNWLKSLAPDPSAQAKYNSSHNWLYTIQQRWSEIVSWHERYVSEGKIDSQPARERSLAPPSASS